MRSNAISRVCGYALRIQQALTAILLLRCGPPVCAGCMPGSALDRPSALEAPSTARFPLAPAGACPMRSWRRHYSSSLGALLLHLDAPAYSAAHVSTSRICADHLVVCTCIVLGPLGSVYSLRFVMYACGTYPPRCARCRRAARALGRGTPHALVASRSSAHQRLQDLVGSARGVR